RRGSCAESGLPSSSLSSRCCGIYGLRAIRSRPVVLVGDVAAVGLSLLLVLLLSDDAPATQPAQKGLPWLAARLLGTAAIGAQEPHHHVGHPENQQEDEGGQGGGGVVIALLGVCDHQLADHGGGGVGGLGDHDDRQVVHAQRVKGAE